MVKARRKVDLAQETLGTDRDGQLGPQDLDRHMAVVLEILRQIDDGHAPATQLMLDGVVFGERGTKGGQGVGHDSRDDPVSKG
jgi:hypothetical protein